jgi:hypothetical protein
LFVNDIPRPLLETISVVIFFKTRASMLVDLFLSLLFATGNGMYNRWATNDMLYSADDYNENYGGNQDLRLWFLFRASALKGSDDNPRIWELFTVSFTMTVGTHAFKTRTIYHFSKTRRLVHFIHSSGLCCPGRSDQAHGGFSARRIPLLF